MKHLAIAPIVLAVAGLLVAACNGGGFSSDAGLTSPSLPTSTSSVSMAGTWSGTSSDSNLGQLAMAWTVTQNGASVTGTVTLTDTASNATITGTLRATMSGRVIGFHVDVPSSGFSGVMSSCSLSADGQASVSDDGKTLAGSYSSNMSGTMSGAMAGQSCGGSVTDGRFTLTR